MEEETAGGSSLYRNKVVELLKRQIKIGKREGKCFFERERRRRCHVQ